MQINSENSVRISSDNYANARICYVFESESAEILEIALGYGTFVNGIAVEPIHLFYQIAETFLDKQTLQELEPYFKDLGLN